MYFLNGGLKSSITTLIISKDHVILFRLFPMMALTTENRLHQFRFIAGHTS